MFFVRPIVRDDLPAVLARTPDLFMDLPILRHLEKLEHYESIQTTTLDEAPAVDGHDDGNG